MLFHLKIFRFEITIIPAAYGSEFQNTIIRVRNTFFIKQSVAPFPKGSFGLLVCQNLHFSLEHDPHIPDQPFVVKIDAGVGVLSILAYSHRRSICGEIEFFQPFSLSEFQHCLYVWIIFVINRTDEAHLLPVDKAFNFLQIHLLVFPPPYELSLLDK